MIDASELNKIVAEIHAEPELQLQEFDASFYSNRASNFLAVTSQLRDEGLICTIGKEGFE